MVLAQIWLIKFQSRCVELQPFLSTLCVFDKHVHVYVCVHEWLLGHVCHDVWMELRGWSLPFTLFKTDPRLSAWILHVFWVLNSSSHACWHTLLIHFPTQLPTQLVYLHGWQVSVWDLSPIPCYSDFTYMTSCSYGMAAGFLWRLWSKMERRKL